MQIDRTLIRRMYNYDLPSKRSNSDRTVSETNTFGLQTPSRVNVLYVNTNTEEISILNFIFPIIMPKADVQVCSDLHEAAATLFERKIVPELIVVDMNSGSFLSKAFAKMLKVKKRFRYIPIIAIGELYSEEEMLKQGFDDFYSKPQKLFEFTLLIKELRNKWLKIGKISPLN